METAAESTVPEPIIQRALGDGWERLAQVVRRHYDVKPGIDESVVMDGVMNIHHSWLAYPLLLVARVTGALVAKRGKDVPVKVRNWCHPGSPAMHWHRSFRFPEAAPRIFASRMEYVAGKEIIEYVSLGLGVRMCVTEEAGALVFNSRGYQWDIGPLRLRLPDWLFLGQAIVREIPIDENRFRVDFRMRHPLLGETFGYTGEFSLNACN